MVDVLHLIAQMAVVKENCSDTGSSLLDKEVNIKYCAMNTIVEEVEEGSAEWKRIKEMLEERSPREKGVMKLKVTKKWMSKAPGLMVTNIFR